jgi:hypothetical protein
VKFYKEDGWSVTTPIYVGSEAEVQKADSCSHLEYAEVVRDMSKGTIFVQERCKTCVATRAKCRPMTSEELKALYAAADGTG